MTNDDARTTCTFLSSLLEPVTAITVGLNRPPRSPAAAALLLPVATSSSPPTDDLASCRRPRCANRTFTTLNTTPAISLDDPDITLVCNMARSNSPNERNAFVCGVCSKGYSRRDYLERHELNREYLWRRLLLGRRPPAGEFDERGESQMPAGARAVRGTVLHHPAHNIDSLFSPRLASSPRLGTRMMRQGSWPWSAARNKLCWLLRGGPERVLAVPGPPPLLTLLSRALPAQCPARAASCRIHLVTSAPPYDHANYLMQPPADTSQTTRRAASAPRAARASRGRTSCASTCRRRASCAAAATEATRR